LGQVNKVLPKCRHAKSCAGRLGSQWSDGFPTNPEAELPMSSSPFLKSEIYSK